MNRDTLDTPMFSPKELRASDVHNYRLAVHLANVHVPRYVSDWVIAHSEELERMYNDIRTMGETTGMPILDRATFPAFCCLVAKMSSVGRATDRILSSLDANHAARYDVYNCHPEPVPGPWKWNNVDPDTQEEVMNDEVETEEMYNS